MSTRMVDQLSAVKLAQCMLNGPATALRRLVADLAIDFFNTVIVIVCLLCQSLSLTHENIHSILSIR